MLSQLLEDYKEAEIEDKRQYVDSFKDLIWSSKYTYKAQKKYMNFKLNESALNYNKDLIELFTPYQGTELTLCKSFYTGKLKSSDYIRIHINNMYGFLTKPEVYLSKEYYQLMLIPKDEYYETIAKLKNGTDVDSELIQQKITDSFAKAEQLKTERLAKKIKLTWNGYKELINKYIDRLFENYTPLHEYEEKNGWKMEVDTDNWNEDNYVASYFCKSLTGYMRNYVRDSKPKVKQCKICKVDFKYKSNKRQYCDSCKRNKQLSWQRKSMQNKRLSM